MKHLVLIVVLLLLFFSFFGYSSRASAVQTPPAKADDFNKNLVRVEKPEAVPGSLAAGFEAISAKDSLAMLSFLASDLLEGRETGTRGFELAAEYAASLLGLWDLMPLGDVPPPKFTLAQFLSGSTVPTRPAEKNFFQEFAILKTADSSSRICLEIRSGTSVKTQSFSSGQDYANLPARGGTIIAPVVFAGYGISEKDVAYDDFKNLDVKGKIVLILSDAPGRDNPESPFQRNQALKDKYFPAPPAGGITIGTSGDRFNKTAEILKRGPAAILQVANTEQDAAWFKRQLPPKAVDDEKPIINKPDQRMALPGVPDLREAGSAPLIRITHLMANALLGASGQTIEDLKKKIESTWKPVSMEIPGTRLTIESTVKREFVRGINVIGAIEGSDPSLKDEVVVIGAHLDHTGSWENYVNNGADDNGSGSVGVLNLARAFSAGTQRPKRTIVFCLWCGEEKGLLGSRFFVQNSPLPKSRIVAYLNMDMISRPYDEKSLKFAGRILGFPVRPDLLKQVNPANFLPVVSSTGSGFGETAREANRYVGLDLYLHEAAGPLFGIGTSDHYSFHDAKVPWLFAISAVTENLHQTSDSIDKISGELIEKASKLMYVIAFRLAEK